MRARCRPHVGACALQARTSRQFLAIAPTPGNELPIAAPSVCSPYETLQLTLNAAAGRIPATRGCSALAIGQLQVVRASRSRPLYRQNRHRSQKLREPSQRVGEVFSPAEKYRPPAGAAFQRPSGARPGFFHPRAAAAPVIPLAGAPARPDRETTRTVGRVANTCSQAPSFFAAYFAKVAPSRIRIRASGRVFVSVALTLHGVFTTLLTFSFLRRRTIYGSHLAPIPALIPMRRSHAFRKATIMVASSKHSCNFLSSYQVISVAFFPSAALGRPTTVKIHLICLRSGSL